MVSTQSASVLPRQRSVTFEPEPGSAPGDTEYEEEDMEASSSPHRPPLPLSPRKSTLNVRRGDYIDVDSESFGILESAARLANSAERAASRRQSRESRRTSSSLANAASASQTSGEPCGDDILTDDGDEDAFEPLLGYDDDEEDDLISLSSEEVSDEDSVNSEPIISARTSKSSFAAISPVTGRRSGVSDASGPKLSRRASALLDFDCPPTPITHNRSLSRRNTGRYKLSTDLHLGRWFYL